MKTIALFAALLALAVPAMARQEASCEAGLPVEQATLSTTAQVELFGFNNSSGTWSSNNRMLMLDNTDSTAANEVWISSFQVTTLTQGVIDTSKSWRIKGGTTDSTQVVVSAGPNVRLWANRVISSTAKLIVRACN